MYFTCPFGLSTPEVVLRDFRAAEYGSASFTNFVLRLCVVRYIDPAWNQTIWILMFAPILTQTPQIEEWRIKLRQLVDRSCRRTRGVLTRRKEKHGSLEDVKSIPFTPILVMSHRTCLLGRRTFRMPTWSVPAPLVPRNTIFGLTNMTISRASRQICIGLLPLWFYQRSNTFILYTILGVKSNRTVAFVVHNADENKSNNVIVHYGWA